MAAVKPNPKHLAVWAIAGATVAACTFFVPLLPIPHLYEPPCATFWVHQWANRFRTLALLGIFFSGATLWLSAERLLKRGYASNVWDDAELTPVRTLVAQPYWLWVTISFFVIAGASVCFTSHGSTFIYLAMLPSNAITSIRRLLTPPTERKGGRIDWKNFKPIHSEHWGQAPYGP